MEEGGRKGTNTQSQHHIAQLTYSGICQNTLYGCLGKGYAGSKEGCKAAHPGYNIHNTRQLGEHEEGTPYQIYTGNNHGCCMNQCRYGSRTLHGIRQPHMKWELARFANRTNKYQQGNDCHQASASHRNVGWNYLPKLHEIKSSKINLQQENTKEQAKITHTGSHKGLLGSFPCRNLVIIETD